jgi:High potential iron-sulfur protein
VTKTPTLESEHYRRARQTGRRCSTCKFYRGPTFIGRCSMFNAMVSGSYLCDAWRRR